MWREAASRRFAALMVTLSRTSVYLQRHPLRKTPCRRAPMATATAIAALGRRQNRASTRLGGAYFVLRTSSPERFICLFLGN